MTAVSEAGAVATGRRTPLRFHSLTVARLDRLCDDAVAVTFAVPDALAGEYVFAAGQSLTLRRVVAGEEHRRSYSICAAEGEAPRIGVRALPGGFFSAWLVREVRVGDALEVSTPTGGFRAPAGEGGRHLCIGAGSGITPLLSVAATALRHPDARVTLLYGNRTSRSVMFAEELADLKDRHRTRFELVHVLSREPRDVDLFSGRLDPDRLRRLLTTLVPVDGLDHVWLCGPFELVEGARAVLAELGMPRERVHVELFWVDEPPPPPRREEAVDATVEVTVTLDGRTSTVAIGAEVSLLEAAQRSRSGVPFACRGGVCGTCRARVVAGEVEMRRNFALDDDEVAAGFVLTCQAHPLTPQVGVDFDA